MKRVTRYVLPAPDPSSTGSTARGPGTGTTRSRPSLSVIAAAGCTALIGDAAVTGDQFVLRVRALVGDRPSPRQGVSTGPVAALVDELRGLSPRRWTPASGTLPPVRQRFGPGTEPGVPLEDFLTLSALLREGDGDRLAIALEAAGRSMLPDWLAAAAGAVRGTFSLVLRSAGEPSQTEQLITHALVLDRDWVELSADPDGVLHGRVLVEQDVQALLVSACTTLVGQTAA